FVIPSFLSDPCRLPLAARHFSCQASELRREWFLSPWRLRFCNPFAGIQAGLDDCFPRSRFFLRQLLLLLKGLLSFTSLAQLLVCAREQRIGLAHLGTERDGRLQFRDRRSRLLRAQHTVAERPASGGRAVARPA